MSQEAPFGKLRSFFWPVHSHELKKLIPMLLMGFFIAFAYNILRSVKDTIIVTADPAGASVIPFLKVWAMLPMALLLTSLFVKLSHRYSSQQVFYMMFSLFMLFFALFTFVSYPLGDAAHLHRFANWLQLYLPDGLSGLIVMIRFWTFSLFYAMCETWGVICLSILFWGFANEITSVSQAARFYGLFALGAHGSGIAAGPVSVFLSNRSFNPHWIIGTTAWHQSLILLTISVLASGFFVMAIYYWLQRNVIDHSVYDSKKLIDNTQVKKITSKPSMRESFAYLAKSKYLTRMAIVVVSYNLVINLVEVLWKDQVKQLYPNPSEYNAYMGHVTWVTGVLATLMAFFISGNVIRRFGWTAAALITPMILLVTSIGFFTFYFFPNDHLAVLTNFMGVTPIVLVALFGSTQNALSRSAKYAVFDTTKELCFIPLTRESKVKGKAAIDGVSSRMGKSGGALVYQGLLLASNNSLVRCAPYVAGILAAVLVGWIIAVKSLGRQLNKVTAAGGEAAMLEDAALLKPSARSPERSPV
ncbi:MAG: NTP/NDP exchange transporter [Verrucomicrobia bacterium]|nr:NTP/NDP exchange transporter [Verrucomicrobiota bacterium]